MQLLATILGMWRCGLCWPAAAALLLLVVWVTIRMLFVEAPPASFEYEQWG